MNILHRLSILTLIGQSFVSGQAEQTAIQHKETGEALPFELSDQEADAIVREKAEARERREAERRERLTDRVNVTVLERKEVDWGERSIIMNRVAPPPVQARPPGADSGETAHKQVSDAEFEAMLRKHQEKEYRTILLSATVYDREFTELRWSHGGERFVAYSNIDFNFMRGVTEFETADAVYSFLLGIGNQNTEDIEDFNRRARERGQEGLTERQIPQKPAFTPGRAEYAVVADDPAIIERDDVFDPIDALHAYFEQNERRLRIEYQRAEALDQARKRYEAATPEEPQDIIINHWRISEGGVQ